VYYFGQIFLHVNKNKRLPDNVFMSNRKKIEYTLQQQLLPWIHFPSCTKGDPGTSHDYRYLGQVGTFVWFANRNMDKELKRVIRDHIHLRSEIFDYASYVVEQLGMFKYVSLHVRRNELQYQQSFISAQQTIGHIRPLLIKNESIYISTDETDPKFFAVIEKEFPVFKWNDFFGEKGKLSHIKIPRKWEGVIEMVTCAMGRIFFGTDTSTFSAYITRLRGYVDAPDAATYHHNEQWTGDLKKRSK